LTLSLVYLPAKNKGSPPQAAGYYCKEPISYRGKPRGIEPFLRLLRLAKCFLKETLCLAYVANKNSDKDMRLYLNRSHCSVDEVVACLDCAYDDGYILVEELENSLIKAEALAKQLTGFTVYLAGKSQS
jgi:hypothetical protein